MHNIKTRDTQVRNKSTDQFSCSIDPHISEIPCDGKYRTGELEKRDSGTNTLKMSYSKSGF